MASISAIDDAAASKTPAAVRTMPSIMVRGASGFSTDSASERPRDSSIGAPSAFANAVIEATRRSGIISRPALIVRSSDGEDLRADV